MCQVRTVLLGQLCYLSLQNCDLLDGHQLIDCGLRLPGFKPCEVFSARCAACIEASGLQDGSQLTEDYTAAMHLTDLPETVQLLIFEKLLTGGEGSICNVLQLRPVRRRCPRTSWPPGKGPSCAWSAA